MKNKSFDLIKTVTVVAVIASMSLAQLPIADIAQAYTDGGSFHLCTSVADCIDALNNDAYTEVRLANDIVDATKGINNPHGFEGKIFDCQGHTIDGDDSPNSQGIFLNTKDGNTIKNCTFTDFDTGIYIFKGSDNVIQNNTFIGLNGLAIKINGAGNPAPGYVASGNIVQDNDIQDVSTGIYAAGATEDTIIQNNTVTGAYNWAIEANGDRDIIRNNQLDGNRVGLYVSGTPVDMVIEGNRVTNSALEGFLFQTTDGDHKKYSGASNNLVDSNYVCDSNQSGDGVYPTNTAPGSDADIMNYWSTDTASGSDYFDQIYSETSGLVFANNTCDLGRPDGICANPCTLPPQELPGEITVCKVITNGDGEITDGSENPGVTFTVPNGEGGGAAIGSIEFTTPLTLNSNLFGDDQENDAECLTFSGLELGSHTYSEETIVETPGFTWNTPLYSDQYDVPVNTLDDLFEYGAGINSDGDINLVQNRASRTLIVLNQYEEVEVPEKNPGVISICKIIVDKDGNVIDGTDLQSTFTIEGMPDITPLIGRYRNDPAGILPLTTFTTPITLNTDFFGNDQVNDGECVVYDDLVMGEYYIGEESIISDYEWEIPRYSDQLRTDIEDIDDFYLYGINDDSNGYINLNQKGPERMFVVLNQLKGIPYASYCGDGTVNQEWEQCDGGEGCLPTCQLEENQQCTDLVLARVNVDNVINEGNGDASSDIFLGSSTNKIPASTWFALYWNGSYFTDPDMTSAGYEDVPGIAVQRLEGSVRTALYGSLQDIKEHVTGDIEFLGVDITGQSDDPSGNNKLENGFDGTKTVAPGQDEVWLDSGDDSHSYFWLTVTTADDAYYTSYGEVPVCPECEDVIVISDTDDMVVDGGNAVLTYMHSAWTAVIDAAQWIWNTYLVENPSTDETYTFEKDFIVDGIAESAQLQIAADNSYTTWINGIEVGADTTERNFDAAGQDSYDVLSAIQSGPNTIKTEVVNWGGSNNPEANPAGLLYRLDIGIQADSCNLQNTPPVIGLIGDNPLELMVGDTYTDPGATASDVEDGDLTDFIAVSGDVDTATAGTYLVNYNVSDSNGAPAPQVTRTVNVSSPSYQCSDGLDNDQDGVEDLGDPACHTDGNPENNSSYDETIDDENSIPVISLLGTPVITITVGDSFTDPEATADDYEDGDITGDIAIGGDTVDTNTVDSYVITYNVVDLAGAAAVEVTRIVVVAEQDGPSYQCSDTEDNDNDQLTDADDPACHTDGDAGNAGSYNPNIDDENSKPIITLIGGSLMTVTVGNSFTDPGAAADDEEDGDIGFSILIGGDTVDTNTVGTYHITYDVNDTRGLAADQVVRTVVVSSGGGGGGGGQVLQQIIIDNGAAETTTVEVDLQLIPQEAVDEMMISNTPDFAGAVWETFQGNKAWTLTSGAGLKTVYAKFKKASYIVGNTVSDDITLTGLPVPPQVLGEFIDLGETCGLYLNSYLKMNWDNDTEEVIKLQTFLNDHGYGDLPLTGFFGQLTHAAVRGFQLAEKESVLTPWVEFGLSADTPTGFVYKTTKRRINEIMCPTFDFPALELP